MSQGLSRSTTRESTRQSGSAGRPLPAELEAGIIGDWLHIEPDGSVVVFAGKAEVGQDIRTSLAQAVAEELRLPVGAIHLVMGDTDRAPYDAGTFGSRTTPTMALRLHRVAAATRELLVDVTAERWGVDRDELRVENGGITHPPTRRVIGFGELTQGQKLTQEWGEDAPVTPAERWTVAGRPAVKVDGQSIVTGRRRYTPDLTVPEMLFGMILRPPAFGATLRSLDVDEAAQLPGVTVVHEGDFAGVAAPTRQLAAEALGRLRAEWSRSEQISSADLFTHLRNHPAPPPADQRWGGPQSYEVGSIEGVATAKTLRQTYTVAYIAHAPLEPRAALAEWCDGRLTVWTGTQRPFGVRSELSQALGLAEEDVRVVVPDTGGAYGGKHTGEVAIEAARLARAAGRPVKLIWSREEEFTWSYFRPAGVIDVAGGVQADGTLATWEFHNYNSGAAGIQTPYEVPNQRVEFHPSVAPLRQGSYRALAATANHFARETHMDELAHAAGIEPLAFRLHNLGDPRLRAVFEAAASRFGWSRSSPAPGCGFGIAGGTEKGSYVATCAEVTVDPETHLVRVLRVVQAFECGAIVNPDGLRNQVEGAIVQGLGGALFEAIEFEDGAIRTNRFSSYRVPRFGDIPAIEVVLLACTDLPSSGAGETPIVAIAPAIGNAIWNATGIRLRSLPLTPDGAVTGGGHTGP